MCVIAIALLVLGLIFLARRFGPPWARKGHRPPWAPAGGDSGTAAPPDEVARRVLAERFAKGDISVEEFLERASALNWYPGDGSEGKK